MTEIEKLIEKYKRLDKTEYVLHVADIIRIARESLPAERQAIEEAYKKGQIDASDRAEFETPLTKPSDYFNKTFKK